MIGVGGIVTANASNDRGGRENDSAWITIYCVYRCWRQELRQLDNIRPDGQTECPPSHNTLMNESI